MKLTQNKLIPPVNSIHGKKKRNQNKKFICIELGVICRKQFLNEIKLKI